MEHININQVSKIVNLDKWSVDVTIGNGHFQSAFHLGAACNVLPNCIEKELMKVDMRVV